MALYLPADCIKETFEYLEDKDLRSCLLVNRLWCEVSVRILWRVMQNFNTLIACLTNKSKAILYKNGIKVSTSISRSPLFNYIIFIKMLGINTINDEITGFLKHQPSTLQKHKSMVIITREILKMFMNQTTLIILHFDFGSTNIPNIPFTAYPGGKECLSDLSEFSCSSDIFPEFFCQISRICHNLQSLKILFTRFISNGLVELISVQKHLKTFIIILEIGGLKNFENLQYVTFPQLQILTFEHESPDYKRLIRLINFLKNNGKNLKVLGLGKEIYYGNSFILDIVNFCPNLRSLRITYKDLYTLKYILIGYEQLESIDILCCNDDYILERELLEMIVEYSPKNFHEIKIDMGCNVDLDTAFQWNLKSIFESWAKRVPCIPLSLTITSNLESEIKLQESNVELLEKFKKFGVIKEFKIFNDMTEDWHC
ncbi:14891_t:CDS:2 [Funneliformis geosporum]|uniref:14891_t:CDS:1 n=1 Tax=Funneliformis geosporum TaxID=1117311 RepID=A0A9W4SU96_9GLOM|nr:14891_t:CDS:2 [Funneliformis geosporum]